MRGLFVGAVLVVSLGLCGCATDAQQSRESPANASAPSAKGDADLTQPDISNAHDAIQRICKLRNDSENDARFAQGLSDLKKTAARIKYDDVQSAGNALIDSFAVSVRNNKWDRKSMNKHANEVGRKQGDLRRVVHSTETSALPDWVSIFIQVAKEAFGVFQTYSQANRDRFSTDIKTTCRWSNWDQLVQPPKQSQT